MAEERRIRTVEGARFFGKPIGSPIDDQPDADTTLSQRAVTVVRLVSLQRQFEAAKRAGDTNRMRKIQDQFTISLKRYAGDGQLIETLDRLIASRGRNDQALGKQSGIKD